MPEIKVTVQGTPNPNAAKFVVDGAEVGAGSRTYFDADDARGDPLAQRLFEVEGVCALFMVDDFITVTKSAEVEWSAMVGRVTEAILSELADSTA